MDLQDIERRINNSLRETRALKDAVRAGPKKAGPKKAGPKKAGPKRKKAQAAPKPPSKRR